MSVRCEALVNKIQSAFGTGSRCIFCNSPYFLSVCKKCDCAILCDTCHGLKKTHLCQEIKFTNKDIGNALDHIVQPAISKAKRKPLLSIEELKNE